MPTAWPDQSLRGKHSISRPWPHVAAQYPDRDPPIALRCRRIGPDHQSGETFRTLRLDAISRGEQSPRAAHITWTGMATYGGSSGPSSVEDMFVTGQADFTRSPLPVSADEYFVRQTR